MNSHHHWQRPPPPNYQSTTPVASQVQARWTSEDAYYDDVEGEVHPGSSFHHRHIRGARLAFWALLGVLVVSCLHAFLLSPAFSTASLSEAQVVGAAGVDEPGSSSLPPSHHSESIFSFLWGRSKNEEAAIRSYHRHNGDEGDHPEKGHGYDVRASQAVVGLQLAGGYPPPIDQLEYERALHNLDWDEVERDLLRLMTTPQDVWPPDYGHYGGLFVRLAWHACGSYRLSDGRGGCDGGAQRFDPERSWPDNTNLDKARRLLEPIKLKHGVGLSWGDLMAFAGTVAIASMGGPTLGFCAGRIDVVDNSQTQPLGPTPEQHRFAPCETNGACPYPLGQNTLGLIYVNPEGPMGVPDPAGAAGTVRDVFGRMDWTGRELVGLIGGGHTFGKAHGASSASPGEVPEACPFAPWAGPKGVDAITSGFEGPWTSHPTSWDNDYFKYLLKFDWEPVQSPAGHWQWRVRGENSPQAPSANPESNETQSIMMLTTDVALLTDPEYRGYIEEFASNLTALDETFAHAWYKLVTRDMGPIARCAGPRVPPPQQWQHALPPPRPHRTLANMDHVKEDLHRVIKSNPDGEFVRLALQCANTYRATDFQGGCNGARIRFSPALDWPANRGLDKTLALLDPVKDKYGSGLSYADLIVLAGNVAAEWRGAPALRFCPGRVDAPDGKAWKHLEYGNANPPATVDEMLERADRRGQTAQDLAALSFAVYGSSRKLQELLGSSGSSTGDDDVLLSQGLRYYPELRVWAEHYASVGDAEYGRAFRSSWTRLMNADRFDGPVRNLCAE
jgi:catalase (peroxidase I)